MMKVRPFGRLFSRIPLLLAICAAVLTAQALAVTYSYDGLGRLISATYDGVTIKYCYDKAGNRKQHGVGACTDTGSNTIKWGQFAWGQASWSAQVTVDPPTPTAPTGTLEADPMSILKGQSTTLTWTSQNATAATIDNGVDTHGAVSGSVGVSPTATTIYNLTVTGNGGTVSPAASITVAVAVPPAPTGSLEPGSSLIQSGEFTTLAWTSANATSIAIDHGVETNGAASGTASVTPTTTTTYTLTLTGPGGTITPQATVAVNHAPVPVPLSLDILSVIPRGGCVTPTGTINPITSATDADGDTLSIQSITQGASGTVSLNGNIITYTYGTCLRRETAQPLTDSFTYTISDGRGGSASALISVNIDAVTGSTN